MIDQNAKSKDYQSLLEDQILRMNYKTFTQVVILGRSSFVPFMQLTPADRRMIIENILSINIFSDMHQSAKAKYSLVREQINDIQRKVENIKEKIEMQEKYLSKLQEQKETSKTKIQNEIDSYISIIKELKNEIEDTVNNVVEDKDFVLEVETLQSEKTQLSSMRDQIIEKTKTCMENVDFYEENSSCPVCKQSIEESFRNEKLSTNRQKYLKLEEGLIEIKKRLSDVSNNIASVRTRRESNSKLDKEISMRKNLIELHKQKLKKLSKEIEEIDQVDDEIEKENKELLILQTKLSDYSESISDIESRRDIYSECVSLLKDSGIKSKIIKQYLPLINKVINTFLTNMNFFTHFELDDQFNEIIKSRHRDEFSYMSFSEGEKMRIDLALLFAWREVAKAKNSAYCNILILDEIFDSSLDSVGTEELMKNLNYLKKNGSVFVISHKLDQMSDKFDRTVVVKKKNNFSRLT